MTTNRITSRGHLRNTILKHKLIPYNCSECNVIDEWNNKSLKLDLDHIDGDRTNNDLSNLRFLCPNCHSQQLTSNNPKNRVKKVTEEEILEEASKCENIRQILVNLKLQDGSANYKRIKRILIHNKKYLNILPEECNFTIKHIESANTDLRFYNNAALRKDRPKSCKIEWPSDSELQTMIDKMPMTHISKILGVSDRAITKRAIRRNLILKPRGFWLKGD